MAYSAERRKYAIKKYEAIPGGRPDSSSPQLKENLTVKSVDPHRSTVELIWMTDRRSILRRIPIMNLLPSETPATT